MGEDLQVASADVLDGVDDEASAVAGQFHGWIDLQAGDYPDVEAVGGVGVGGPVDPSGGGVAGFESGRVGGGDGCDEVDQDAHLA